MFPHHDCFFKRHFWGIKPQWTYYETWCFSGNKFPLYDQKRLSAEVWAWSNLSKSFVFHIKPQACNFSLWLCRSLWSVTTFTSFFSKHYYTNEIHSKSFEISDQNFMLLLLPSEHTDFLHCYNNMFYAITPCAGEKRIGQSCHNTFSSMISGFFQLRFCNNLTSQYETSEVHFSNQLPNIDNVPTEPERDLPLILIGPWAYSSLYFSQHLQTVTFAAA